MPTHQIVLLYLTQRERLTKSIERGCGIHDAPCLYISSLITLQIFENMSISILFHLNDFSYKSFERCLWICN